MEQVICIDDTPNSFPWRRDPVVKGQIYTIKRITPPDRWGDNGYEFYEVRSGLETDGTEIGFNVSRFRPINDKSLDIFRDTKRKIPSDKFDLVTVEK